MSVMSLGDLHGTLTRIDGRGYRAYRDLEGVYALGPFQIDIAHVQGDPYAPPSRVHVRAALDELGLLQFAQGDAARILGLEDFLGRAIARRIEADRTRDISIDRYGQEILKRSAVWVAGGHLEVRLFVQLPAAGRRILGQQAKQILSEDLPGVLEGGLSASALDTAALALHQDGSEDYRALVDQLEARGWIGFIADGSVLPRRAGHDDRPLEPGEDSPVIRFEAPATLQGEVTLPHAGRIQGMPVLPGVTLLVGGGFHGKSTVLEALSRGIYPHIPGDGREQVAAHPETVKVRAEDGRAVTAADISPFIGELPFGRSTRSFSTQNASGSTSQAANIVEALEAGARVLLLDEDTSATNFMIRDEPMRRLLRPGQEPITPYLDRVRNLFRDRGVSTVLVVGGSGEYFRVADRVVQMDRYLPVDVTAAAKEIAPPGPEETAPFPPPPADRCLRLDRYQQRVGPKGPRVKAPGKGRLLVEREEVDLGACEQLVSLSQVRLLAAIIEQLIEKRSRSQCWMSLSGGCTPSAVREVFGDLEEDLLQEASRFPRGDLAMVRPLEMVALLNRLREVSVT